MKPPVAGIGHWVTSDLIPKHILKIEQTRLRWPRAEEGYIWDPWENSSLVKQIHWIHSGLTEPDLTEPDLTEKVSFAAILSPLYPPL